MKNYLFFDTASTTRCCAAASDQVQHYDREKFGNPSSSHELGCESQRAIREARQFFGDCFRVPQKQVIFTGSGTESDNLAIMGVSMPYLVSHLRKGTLDKKPRRILVSSIEHPAVKESALSLKELGFDVQQIPINREAQVDEQAYLELLTSETVFVSIMGVNNIVGSVLPVEQLAEMAKKKCPEVIFHSDLIQAFGKVETPQAPSSIDLVSISGHKIEGPKGIGALIFLDEKLMKRECFRPLIWGGGQESGFRSGTQNAGLISGFHFAAEQILRNKSATQSRLRELNQFFKRRLEEKSLIHCENAPMKWNSPDQAVPHIINLSAPYFPSGPLAKLIEEQGCLIATGSACSSLRSEPEPVLTAMGLKREDAASSLRVSFSPDNTEKEIELLVESIQKSLEKMQKLLGMPRAG